MTLTEEVGSIGVPSSGMDMLGLWHRIQVSSDTLGHPTYVLLSSETLRNLFGPRGKEVGLPSVVLDVVLVC